jgi:hypothetical protein
VFALDVGGDDGIDGTSASDAPQSPRASLRPGSAMSMSSRRSATPTGSTDGVGFYFISTDF